MVIIVHSIIIKKIISTIKAGIDIYIYDVV